MSLAEINAEKQTKGFLQKKDIVNRGKITKILHIVHLTQRSIHNVDMNQGVQGVHVDGMLQAVRLTIKHVIMPVVTSPALQSMTVLPTCLTIMVITDLTLRLP